MGNALDAVCVAPAMTIPTLRAGTPDWLDFAIVVASVLLAALTIALAFTRVRTSADDGLEEQRRRPVDPVLILSALGIVALAIAAWTLR